MSDSAGSTPDHAPSASVDAEGDTSNNGSFLVHSKRTLTQDLPPKVDNKVLSRQRRRRTSPEDHAILETEYQRNPKPDKITRASIVSRVSLGDKEVQIWFQNRRQNDRRRSKPLQPHEFLPSANGIIHARVSDERSTANAVGAQTTDSKQIECSFSKPTLSPNTSFGSCTDSESNSLVPSSQLASSQTTISTVRSGDGSSVADNNENWSPNEPVRATQSPSSAGKRKRSDSDVRGVYRPERRQTIGTTSNFVPPSLRISLSFDGEAIVRKEDEKTPSPPKVRDPVRISFSADGEAVVRTANEPSPSKNRASAMSARQSRFGTLRRCNSAVSLGTTSGISSLKDKLFGRSRDSRAWERYCDTDARSALSTSHGESGYSNKAINPAKALLTRQTSESGNTKPQATRKSMSNALTPPSGPPPEKRKKLSRAVSSLGRLESERRYTTSLSGTKQGVTKDSAKDLLEYEAGDSDKENWIPGTQISSVRRKKPNNKRRVAQGLRQMSPGARRGAGNPQALSRSKRPNGVRGPKLNSIKHEQYLSEDGDGASLEPGTTSQVEDLDCVQGLLSLSQGAWG